MINFTGVIKLTPCSLYKKLALIIIAPFIYFAASAQSLDVDILKSINPAKPNSQFWINTSSSAYPVTIGIQGGLLAYDYFRSDSIKAITPKIIAHRLIVIAFTEGMKYAFNRQRPYVKYPDLINGHETSETGMSFPSAHTALAFNTAAIVSIRYHKWYVTVPAYMWATSVGYSRLYLGEHYPSDVLVGAAVGVGSAYLSEWLNKKIIQKKQPR